MTKTEHATVWLCTDCHLALAGYSEDELGYTPEPTPLHLISATIYFSRES